MKTGTIITGIVFAGVIGIGAISYISAYNMGNRMEKNIIATDDNNRNILAQYGNRVSEAAQVPAMQRDDLTQVVTAALEGRYGEDGSQAVFQWIQEQNPQIDSTVYVQLQRIIESGRIEFANAQTQLVDQRRVYETALGTFWGGTWLSIAGYPSIDLDEYQIVSTSRADEAFETGVEEPIQLR
jgi:uncharacterized protein YneF (UPF0154 family)